MKALPSSVIHLFFGLMLGLLSGLLSTWGLGDAGELIRPALTFWTLFFVYWLFATQSHPKATLKSIAHWFVSLEKAPHNILILAVLWTMAYWVQLFFAAFGATGMMIAGTLLTFASAAWMLKLRFPWSVLWIGFTVLLFAGLWMDHQDDGYVSWYLMASTDPQGDMPIHPTHPIFKTMILIWQTVAFGALALQMEMGKLRRVGAKN